MEALVRLTERRTHRGGTNPVGEIICVRDDGWPWSATERSTFRVVRISGPGWLRDAMESRVVRFRTAPAVDRMDAASALVAMQDDGGVSPTEVRVRSALARRRGEVPRG